MNITEVILHSPLHPSTDVRTTSQGSEYPLSTIVRREYDFCTDSYTGPLTHEGVHLGTGLRTGTVRADRDDALADIRRFTR